MTGPVDKRRLRVAALIHGVGGGLTGVRRLILDQAKAWAALEPDVDFGLFVRCEAGTEDAWRHEPNVVSVRSSPFGIAGRLVARELLSAEVARWQPDLIYLRHTTVSPSIVALAAQFPMIVGGDLDDLEELRVRSIPRYWYARIARDHVLRRARRIMVHTHELSRSLSITHLGKPVDVFPNSIEVDAYPELPAPRNVRPRLVFLGSPHLFYAGVDKIPRLAARCPDWDFDIVGPGRDQIPHPPPNLAVHGVMRREEYLPIMARADVAIGTLALHRKQLNEVSTLKVAEYLALGLPVILGNAETAFPDGAPFLLELPNTEDNVDRGVESIRQFVESWRGRRVPRPAVGPVDTRVVERARLDVILAEARRGARVHAVTKPSAGPPADHRLRIAYLAHGIEGAESGVRAKILTQVQTWGDLNPRVEVGVFIRCEAGAEADWRGQPGVVGVRSSRAGIIGRLIQRERLSLDVIRWRPDVIYYRQSTVSPSVVLLSALIPTALEINTLDLAELRIRSRPRYLYSLATRAAILRLAKGIVAVSREIGRHPSVARLGHRIVVVPNAIDLAANPPLAAPHNERPRLIFLGAPRLPWHGIDKIGRLALGFPDWDFDVVGPSPDEFTSAPDNLHVHGLLRPDGFLPLLAAADIGLGPLALHRKSMSEASPLKVAEYLARGLPVIGGYVDTRFPDGAPFMLQIPNAEDNVESASQAIEAFVTAWVGHRVDRGALDPIDTRHVEARRLAFITGLVDATEAPDPARP